MHLMHLSLTNFRAFSRLDLDLPRRIILFHGANAQGKTTLLESIYYLATLTSFHTPNDRQLISLFAPQDEVIVSRIVADYRSGQSVHKIEVRLILERQADGSYRYRKESLLDGAKKAAHELAGHFLAVIFLPQMTRTIEGGPDERRRYLNLVLMQAQSGYARLLSEYDKALSQRNALLKMIAEDRGQKSQLEYWDQILAKLAGEIIFYRQVGVRELNAFASGIHYDLTDTREVMRVEYKPAFSLTGEDSEQINLPLELGNDLNGMSAADISDKYVKRLIQLRPEEIARGVTTIGPHRDNLVFTANGANLGDFGSRGQIRTCLLAMKLAEAEWLHTRSGQWPVILLDEILAELDLHRRKDLLKHLRKYDQSLMTTTDRGMFDPEFLAEAAAWQVVNGQVQVSET